MGIKIKKIKNWAISYLNESELDEMLNELYHKNYYIFQSKKPDPVIFDVGALIGETVLYFKDLYPRAKITAFEPSPRSFSLLKKNVSQNKLTNIKLINAAVSGISGKLDFYTSKSKGSPWARGDSLKENRFNNKLRSKVVKVKVVRLSSYIKSNIDLLKIDIEGAETEVITEIEPKIKYVKQIILEFHANKYNPQNSFPEIIKILERNNFDTSIYISEWQIPKIGVNIALATLPLLQVDEYWLRIYAKRN